MAHLADRLQSVGEGRTQSDLVQVLVTVVTELEERLEHLERPDASETETEDTKKPLKRTHR